MRVPAACALLVAWWSPAAPAAAIEVSITGPTSREPAFGRLEVVVEVRSDEPVAVELWVDGLRAGRLEEPPFRFGVDVGEANVSHHFEARVTGRSGRRAFDALTTPSVTIDERVELELQQIYLTARRGGSLAGDLEREDFEVFDTGARQELVTFERGDVPFTAVSMVDTSDSMRGQLGRVLGATRAFIAGMRPLDRAMLLFFSDRTVLQTPFTGFPDVLTAAMSGVTAGGGTALADHLYLALKLLEERQGRRVVLLLSDGLDSASLLEMRDLLWAAERSQALVYWLRLPVPPGRFSSAWRGDAGFRRELDLLETLVVDSGGRVVPLADVEAVPRAFAEILEELRGQYVLGYYPTTRSDDGAWRPIDVRVRAGGLKLHFRNGYVDH